MRSNILSTFLFNFISFFHFAALLLVQRRPLYSRSNIAFWRICRRLLHGAFSIQSRILFPSKPCLRNLTLYRVLSARYFLTLSVDTMKAGMSMRLTTTGNGSKEFDKLFEKSDFYRILCLCQQRWKFTRLDPNIISHILVDHLSFRVAAQSNASSTLNVFECKCFRILYTRNMPFRNSTFLKIIFTKGRCQTKTHVKDKAYRLFARECRYCSF
jgi:hypothetical protein